MTVPSSLCSDRGPHADEGPAVAHRVETAASPCRRWRDRQTRFRPSGERINTSMHTVAPMEHAPARAFVEVNHYSGAWPAVRRAYGLYHDLRPVDVVALKKPAKASDLRLVGVAALAELGAVLVSPSMAKAVARAYCVVVHY